MVNDTHVLLSQKSVILPTSNQLLTKKLLGIECPSYQDKWYKNNNKEVDNSFSYKYVIFFGGEA